MKAAPILQTIVLPLLLALLAMAALRVWPGERWAGFGAILGLLGALAWLPGFEWPAHSRTLKLPWVVLVGLGLALLATARGAAGARPTWTPPAAVAVWVGAALWLADGQASTLLLVGAGLLGGAVLWQMAGGRGHSAAPAAAGAEAGVGVGVGLEVLPAQAAMAVAALGLAALAATGGSLLLAQLAGMLASCALAAVGWAWLRPSAPLTAGTGGYRHRHLPRCLYRHRQWHWPLGLAWLCIAWTWVLAAPAASSTRALQVALLALAFLVPALFSRLPAAALAPRWRLPAAVLLAALMVVLAGWVGTAGTPMPDTPVDLDDPYLTP